MAFLLGAWLVGMVLIAVVAAENFFMVDRLLDTGALEFQQKIAPLSPGDARIVLRYLSSELNRFYFWVWGAAEIVIGGVLLLLAVTRGRDRKLTIGASVMLGLSVLMTFYLTPQLVEIGRGLDFPPRNPPPPQLGRFGMLHGAYSTFDLIKLVIGIWLTSRIVRGKSELRA
jgi:hypothetical protein